MDNPIKSEETAISTSSSQSPSYQESVTRPNTLNILLENNQANNLLPSLNESLLKSGVEKLLQQWASSPQTPGTFLNPKSVTEEQELFANAFTQKLCELRDSNSISSLTTSITNPGTFNPSPLPNMSLPDAPSNLPDLAKLLCQAAQQQAGLNSPILFYTPITGTTNSSSQIIQTTSSQTNCSTDGTLPDLPSLPVQTPDPLKDHTSVQLPNGLKLELNAANGGISPLLNLLGLASQVSRATGQLPDTLPQNLDPLSWPMQINTSVGSSIETPQYNAIPSPHMETDTRPSSQTNSLDQSELCRPPRPSSSISSSSSQSNSKDNGSYTSTFNNEARFDPTEQYRMRLERKRARNRDAARKCRERKIRLIKSLERDVYQLSEENKSLKCRLTRSKAEIERLRLFLADHIDKECPSLLNNNKVV